MGSEALPDLTEWPDDLSRGIQRSGVIINIGTDPAYRSAGAISGTSPRDCAAWSASVTERYLFRLHPRHIDHRGPTAPVYLRSIESLGAQRDPEGIEALKEVLFNRGEWWAPRRTAQLRSAAAAALARIGTPEALAVLDEAITTGRRGVRHAARAHIAGARTRRPAPRGEEA